MAEKLWYRKLQHSKVQTVEISFLRTIFELAYEIGIAVMKYKGMKSVVDKAQNMETT